MSDYGVFEASSTDGHEEEQQQRQAQRDLGRAIEAAREGFGDFLGAATDKDDYKDRLALVMNDLMQKVADAGVMPVPGVMRKVKAALRPQFRKTASHPEYGEGAWSDEGVKQRVLSLNPNLPVPELVDAIMREMGDLYDSIDRELAFWYFSQVTGKDYDDFYNAWLTMPSGKYSSRKQAGLQWDKQDYNMWSYSSQDSGLDYWIKDRSDGQIGWSVFDYLSGEGDSGTASSFEEAEEFIEGFIGSQSPDGAFNQLGSRKQAGTTGGGEEVDLSDPSSLSDEDLIYWASSAGGSYISDSESDAIHAEVKARGFEQHVRDVQNYKVDWTPPDKYNYFGNRKALRKQANNYEEIADRAADDFERDTGKDPYTDPNFITQYLPAWASANAQDIAFDPALYEKLETEANMLGYGYTVESTRKQAAGLNEFENMLRANWGASFYEFLNEFDEESQRDAREEFKNTFGVTDADLNGFLPAIGASRKQASDVNTEDQDVLQFFYQFEDEGLDVSASGDEQWEWIKSNIDYDVLQDAINQAHEYSEISSSSADALAYELQQNFFGSRKKAGGGNWEQSYDGADEWKLTGNPQVVIMSEDDGFYLFNGIELVEVTDTLEQAMDLGESSHVAGRKQAGLGHADRVYLKNPDGSIDRSSLGVVFEVTPGGMYGVEWRMSKGSDDGYDSDWENVEDYHSADELVNVREVDASRKQASAYLPVVSVEQNTGDSYMAELKGGFAFEAYDEGGTWVWSIFNSSGNEVASDETSSLDAAKDDAAYALERVASRKRGSRADSVEAIVEFLIFCDEERVSSESHDSLDLYNGDDEISQDDYNTIYDFIAGDLDDDIYTSVNNRYQQRVGSRRRQARDEYMEELKEWHPVEYDAFMEYLGPSTSYDPGELEFIHKEWVKTQDPFDEGGDGMTASRKQAESYSLGGGWSARVVYDSDDEGEYAEAILTGPGGVEETIYPGNGRSFEPDEVREEARLIINEYGDSAYQDTYQYNSRRSAAKKEDLRVGQQVSVGGRNGRISEIRGDRITVAFPGEGIDFFRADQIRTTLASRKSKRKQALEIGEWEEDLPGLGYAKATKVPGGGWEVYIWDEAGQNETLTPVNSSEEARLLFYDTIKSYPGSGFDHIDF